MKTVGKQLQEARLAKNWTPELAARETKIKVERLRDLEIDDYSNFSSPTYARGFVRTYARSLGLNEYNILRQLDNKLPDDDSVNIVNDNGGVAYLPETSMPPRAAYRNYTGLYIVMALGGVVALVITLVLFEAYRVGELSKWLGGGSDASVATTGGSTNAATASAGPTAEPNARALPVDSNTPPPIADTPPTVTNAPADTAPSSAPRALPVDLNAPMPVADTPPAPTSTPPPAPPRALPVDPAELNAPAPAPPKAPLRALPVTAADLAADTGVAPKAVALNTPPVPAPAPTPAPTTNSPEMAPSMQAVAPSAASQANNDSKPLVLTASHDSFVKVTNLDAGDGDKAPVYNQVLKTGQSVAFSGHKFSINASVPAAVDIELDGVNYGPLSDGDAPKTFTVQSHLQ
jgi:cytoskeleton protein RodZ